MGGINPEILTWARETAGLSLEAGAHAIGLNDAHGKKGLERLAAMEMGNDEPSRSVLLRMAKAYRRSLLIFYLNAPPRMGDRGHDFRTVPGLQAPPYDPDLDALIRDIKRRQSLVKSLLEDIESENLYFIGSATMALSVDSLAERIAQHINFSLPVFQAQATVALAFTYLRSKLEASGVFVLLLGNLGSHHTNISTDTFRGFAIADRLAPFVVVNDHDAKAAWSFTAIHELVHLWLGNTGVSGASAGARIEQYCSDVAGEILLPASQMSDLEHLRSASLNEAIGEVSNFARSHNVSRAMVAYRLFRLNFINMDLWADLRNHFKKEWLEAKSKQAEKQRAVEGGPSYYTIRRHRLGKALLGLMRRSLIDGSITYTKAGQVLGVKPRNVEPLLEFNFTQGIR